MKVNDSYSHFVTIVAGNNPEELMEPFDSLKKLEKPVTIYKLSDSEKIRKTYIVFYSTLLKNDSLTKEERSEIELELEEIKEMSDDEFYYTITSGCEYDSRTGDAITYKNPNGKYISFALGKIFSVPFIMKSGNNAFQAYKKDIDWEKMHLNNKEVYESAWETVVEGREPKDDEEKLIYENMKNRISYFEKFSTKENYVISSTAFWGYAFLDNNGWKELGDEMNQYDWMNNFYDNFIKPLPDDTLLTIYECRRE